MDLSRGKMYFLVSGNRLCDDGCYDTQGRSTGLHCVYLQVHCLVLFMQLLATCVEKKCLKQVHPIPAFSFCVDHLSLRCCIPASKYYYSSRHMHLTSNDIHSAPFLTSTFTNLVVCEGGVTVYAHLRIGGVHCT